MRSYNREGGEASNPVAANLKGVTGITGEELERKVSGKLCARINHVKPRGICIDKFFYKMGV